MVRTSTLYSLAKLLGAAAGALAGFGGVMAVYAGAAAPTITASMAPESPVLRLLVPGVLGVVGLVTGVTVVSRLERRNWIATGRAVGLSPEDGSGGWVSGKPAFTGRVRGRPVRVYAKTVRTGGSNSTKIHTVVEAGLNEPVEGGVLVTRNDGGGATITIGEDDGIARLVESLADSDAGTVVRDEPFLALATSEAVGRAVLSGRSREALADFERGGHISIGDVEPVLTALTAGVSDVPLVSTLADTLVEKFAGDPRVATTRGVRGLVLDADELERQVDAVVATADAFERALSGG